VAGWKAAHPGSDPFKDATSLFNFYKASKFPYFDSLFKELLRFTSLSFSMRRIEENGTTLIGDKGRVFTFSEGDMVVCYTRSTHLDEEVYSDAHKFIPERFMEDVRHTKNGKDLPNYWMPFGGGITMVSDLPLCRNSVHADTESVNHSKCSGRHFAAAEIQIATIWLLSHYQIRLNPSTQPQVRRDLSKVGFGIMRNRDDPTVLLTKRVAKA
jgi:cytochrome P450